MDLRAQQVQDYLEREGLEPLNFDQPTPTSVAAAEAIGCHVGEIAKSILMLIGQQPIMVITSGDTRVKSGRLKEATGLTGKVRLPAADEVQNYTGYKPGGVSPFLLPDNLPVLLDKSLQRFAVVYPAAATDSSGVALTFARLEELCSGKIVDVCDIHELKE
ncbi:MAG: YbaK/EbsC family protein [Gammaproteobacteria bacterium]|nr:YbaK/EbsC family protein [Gammaproteobacteria bacterium]NIN62578.1 YbaK/EbsC family protein [Gammaproteobacteria bacterium]NIO62389.1 YbaK/EbsC family protein [Gammaproteobacteria bacterium]NIT06407.1 YbaK/EbsC family protein [Gammaproteobacteria bacterium]NIT41870.1 YbaK/EbsC family protein [Gammaproteobacteria bacterium]